jgi:hypothetical protein
MSITSISGVGTPFVPLAESPGVTIEINQPNAASNAAAATTITTSTTETNPDGSTTTTVTYADGTTITTTTVAVPGAGPSATGLLDSNNAAQGITLLAAQAELTTGLTGVTGLGLGSTYY